MLVDKVNEKSKNLSIAFFIELPNNLQCFIKLS